MTAAPEPIFVAHGHELVPTGHARGPWDPGAQHGGAPGALLARAVERLAPDFRLARLTIEFLGAVGLEPVSIEAVIVKHGRRLQLAEATLAVAGRERCRARAVLLRRAELEGLPPEASCAGPPPFPSPDASVSGTFPLPGQQEGFGVSAMELRFARGDWGVGPAAVWFRFARPLVEGETPSPVQRAVAAADFGNGVSRGLDFDAWLFVNTDLTVHLHRPPGGEWVGLDARTVLEPNGTGLSLSTLHDPRGAIGTGHQTLFVAPR
jgi:hypothetical protein